MVQVALNYNDVLELGKTLGLKGLAGKEEGGKFKLSGTAEYEFDKNEMWQKIKSHSGWENEVQADIKVEKTDVYGYWTVKSGESLSKIAKDVYDDAGKYTKIYEANKATIGNNPNLIKPGQKLVLPNK